MTNLVVTPCSVCSHKYCAAIDQALSKPWPGYRKLARAYGLSTTSLHRHWKHHVKPKLETGQEVRQEAGTPKTPEQPPPSGTADRKATAGAERTERQKAWARFVLADMRQAEQDDDGYSNTVIPEEYAPRRPADATYWDEKRGVWRRRRKPGVYGRDWM